MDTTAGFARTLRRRAKKLLLFAVVTYAVVVAIFAVFQRALLYFPTRVVEASEIRRMAALGLSPVRARAGDVLAYHAPHPEGVQATLIIAHGNAGSASDRTYLVDLARAAPTRFDVLLLEYPGYAARAGVPTQRGNVDAVLEAIDHAKAADRPIVLLGESLGSAVVALAAAERPRDLAALVLVTPLPSLADVASHHYPFLPTRLIVDRYEASAALERFRGPVAFVVAGEDEVVPTPLGMAMHQRYTGPKLLEIDAEATHNAVDYTPRHPRWQRVFAFVDEALRRARP